MTWPRFGIIELITFCSLAWLLFGRDHRLAASVGRRIAALQVHLGSNRHLVPWIWWIAVLIAILVVIGLMSRY